MPGEVGGDPAGIDRPCLAQSGQPLGGEHRIGAAPVGGRDFAAQQPLLLLPIHQAGQSAIAEHHLPGQPAHA
jgi:hypothetical protein